MITHINNSFLKEIAEKTVGELQSFLGEIQNKTQNYKSLFNLTEQMTHDYANRFIIELLQNGYDVIKKSQNADDTTINGKVKIVLDEKENAPSALYFANSGVPLSSSNFIALTSLALSDKSPSDSVGNKGIGFKSVLQVCKTPQIYSGHWSDEHGFDGHCFEFNPEKVELLSEKVNLMIEDKKAPDLSDIFGISINLKDWSLDRISELERRASLLAGKAGTVRQFFYSEMNYLSPYALPFPLTSGKDSEILRELGRNGYVTVIRLELNQPEALELAKQALSELNDNSWLFLDSISQLEIEHIGEVVDDLSRTMSKTETSLSDSHVKLSEVVIGTVSPKKYWIWSKTIGGDSDPDLQKRIQQAASKLPGKWNTFNGARIEIAVLNSGKREAGLVFIYLPTQQSSDLAAHLNAPFFGQMNRKRIDCSVALNKLLLEELSGLLFYAVSDVLERNPAEAGDMIIDLLSFRNNDDDDDDEPGNLIREELIRILEQQDIELEEWAILPYQGTDGSRSFGSINEVYRLPDQWNYSIFTQSRLSGDLEIKLLSGISKDRLEAVDRLAKSAGGFSMLPTESYKASWTELMAEYLLKSQAEMEVWQLFYDELVDFVSDPSDLFGKPILLGQDGKLHCGGDEDNDSRVFLSSVQSSDAESLFAESSSASSGRIPSFLNDDISYFHPDIRLYNTKDGHRTKSKLLGYLRQDSPSLVEEYSVGALLDKVILEEMPEENETIIYGSEKSEQLYEILAWTISLYYNARSPLQSIQDKFTDLWLPCRSGWLPATKAYFAESWDKSDCIAYGEMLMRYFQAAGYEEALQKQLLSYDALPPSLQEYGLNKLAYFFRFCGGADYLRLVPVVPDRSIIMSGSSGQFYFSAPGSGSFFEAQMDYFKLEAESLKNKYNGYFRYKIEKVDNIDGIWAYEQFDQEEKLIFSKLVVHSIAQWDDDWRELRITKQEGERWSGRISSLVAITLNNLPWVPTGKESQVSFKKLHQSWYVSTEQLRFGSHGFSFIPYVTQSVAMQIEADKVLDALCELGLSRFEFTTTDEGAKLLNDLAELFENKQVPSEMTNYLRGHYKKTWDNVLRLMRENDDRNIDPPRKLLCLNGKSIKIMDLDRPDNHVYIPDDKKLFINLQQNALVPILLIDNRMEYPHLLKELYGNRLSLLSELIQSVWVDGVKWTEEQASASGELLIQDERSWLLPFILAVATFREESQIYIGNKRFSELLSALNRARVVFCADIEVLLENQDGDCIHTKKELMHVGKAHETFFVSEQAEGYWEELASAIAEYLEIMPMEWSLKYAFSKLQFNFIASAPLRIQILEALRLLKIPEEDFESVERTLNDDLQWSKERLLPILYMYNVVDEIEMDQIIDKDEWQENLIRLLPSRIDVAKILRIAKESASDYQMGYQLYEAFGITLSEWNQALALSSDSKPAVVNVDLNYDFNNLKNFYKESIIAVLRSEVRSGRQLVEMYAENKAHYEAWAMPEDWVFSYWSLPESLFINSLTEQLNEMKIEAGIIKIYESQQTHTEIIVQLPALAVDLTQSVYEIKRDNYKTVKTSLNQILAAFISYFVKDEKEPPAHLLNTEQTVYHRILEESREEELELHLWVENDAYSFIFEKNCFLALTTGLPEGTSSIRTLDALLILLQVQRTDLDQAKQKIEQLKEDRSRARRTVKINGQEFVADEENLPNLGRLLDSIVLDKNAVNGAIDRPLSLKKILPDKGGNGNGTMTGTTVKTQRMHRQVEEAVGLAGEIFVYRYLSQMYPKVCTPESWKSENSMYEFQGKTSNDRLGYDFEIRLNKKTYHIEVKTTTGSDPQFELGSSEQRAAIEDSGKRNTEFVIMFVTDVFECPRLHWLPNPYSTKGKELFTIKEAGARVSFRF